MGKREDAFRMEVVSRARVFKRSWVDMAQALVEVRDRGFYTRWGYDTLHGYATEELHIKRTTVDKLTGSYHALERHAPHVLSWDGVAQAMPEMESVEFFAKALDPEPRDGEPSSGPPPSVVEELKTAIFDEGASAPALRRRFNSVLFPKEEGDAHRELLSRARAGAQRLEQMIVAIDGLSEERVEQVSAALTELRRDLDALAGPSIAGRDGGA